jgi:hypothetical protein
MQGTTPDGTRFLRRERLLEALDGLEHPVLLADDEGGPNAAPDRRRQLAIHVFESDLVDPWRDADESPDIGQLLHPLPLEHAPPSLREPGEDRALRIEFELARETILRMRPPR